MQSNPDTTPKMLLTVSGVTVSNVPMVAANNTQTDNPINLPMAARGMWTLARDTSRTDAVFTIISALTGNSFERTYQQFIRTEYGQTLLRERPILMQKLSDREALAALPEGSLGREYLRFMEEGKLTAEGLVDAQNTGVDPTKELDLDEDRRYVADRIRDQHDLWHVLTDYGCDDTGEIANLWFSVGQFGNPGMAFIAFFGMMDGIMDRRLLWPRFCYRALKRGLSAKRLVSEPLEDLLPLPIDEARRRLGIALTREIHPEGIRYGYRKNRELGAVSSHAN